MLTWILLTALLLATGSLWWRMIQMEKRLDRISTRLRAIHDDTAHQHRALEVRLDRILEYIERDAGCDRAA